MSQPNQQKSAQTCYIYWDYENCPIPRQSSSLGNVVDVIKQKIYKSLGKELRVVIKLYIKTDKIPQKLQRDFEICGINHFQIPALKPEAVDKRMLVDVALDLYDWKGVACNAVVLISGDQDFGNILSRIHNVPEIVTLILMRLPKDNGSYNNVNPNLLKNVDDIIDDFKVQQFIDCRHAINCNRAVGQCLFYHHKSHYNKIQNNSQNKANININETDEKQNAILYYNQIQQQQLQQSQQQQQQQQMNAKTLEIRSKIACHFKNNCTHWKAGNCNYFHAKPFVSQQANEPIQQMISANISAPFQQMNIDDIDNIGTEITLEDKIWNAYIDKFGNEPKNASQLLSFSNKDFNKHFTFKTANQYFNKQTGNGKVM